MIHRATLRTARRVATARRAPAVTSAQSVRRTFTSMPARGALPLVARHAEGRLTTNMGNKTMSFRVERVRMYSTLPEGVSVITLPALSPTMESGTIAEWTVKEGDKVSPGTVLCSVETDKANVDFEFQDDGYIAKILVPKGATDIPLGAPIALLAEDEDALKRAENFTYVPEEQSAAEEEAPAQPTTTTQTPPTTTTTAAAAGGRLFASPLARKIAAERGVDLEAMRGMGTGANGRIVKDDVLKFAASAKATATAAPTTARAAAPAASVAAPTAGDFVDVPISNMRKVIANRLQQSKSTIPHYYLTVECEVDNLLKVRARLNKQAEKTGAYKLSVNDFIVKAAALAMKHVPEVNSSWQDTFIRQYNNVDVCVAVQTDSGLLTPIVADAEKKGLAQISSEVKELAAKAREGKLQPHEFQGGTFTVSNLGMFGISEFSAIINPPQACILAVGTTEQKVVPTEKGEVPYKTVTTMKVTLSCDHRVVDGAVGARWLQEFKKNIEDPLNMLL